MAEEFITAKFNLDTKEALSNAVTLKERIAALGDAENISGLVTGIISLSPEIAAVGASAFVLKKTLDTVFEAENIKAYNAQFEILTRNAGISSSALRDGLERAANGLIDTTDLIHLANQSLVTMGASAERLPEVLELARQVAVVTGKDAKTAFDELTSAINMGTSRALKHMGIVVDLNKATSDYAKANGLAVNALSEVDKRQAILNEVLRKGKSDLSGITDDIKVNTNTWIQLKNTIVDIKETLIVAFDRTIGPVVNRALKGLSSLAKGVRTELSAAFGEGVEKARAQLPLLEEELQTERAKLARMIESGPSLVERLFGTQQRRLDVKRKVIADIESQIAEINNKLSSSAKEAEESGRGLLPQPKPGDLDKLQSNHAAFLKDMLALQQASLDARTKLATTEEETQKIFSERAILLEREKAQKIQEIRTSDKLNSSQQAQEIALLEETFAARAIALKQDEFTKIAELRQKDIDATLSRIVTSEDAERILADKKSLINAQYTNQEELVRQSTFLAEEEKNRRLIELEQRKVAEISALNNQLSEFLITAATNAANQAQSANDRFAAGAALASRKAMAEITNFAKLGELTVNTFANKVGMAFVAVGEGSEDLGSAMKKAIIGAVADIALAKGIETLAASVFPPNPLGIAAGTGLVVTAGVLRAMAGAGATATPGVASTPGISGSAITPGRAISETQTPFEMPGVAEHEQERKQVTIQIQGHYFETEQTKTRLVEIIREASDATDFKIISVGGGI